MFDLLKKKIGGFIDNLTKKEEEKVEKAPPEEKPEKKEVPVEKPAPPVEEKPTPSEDGGGWWEAERIVNTRVSKKDGREYRVRWKGYSPREDSWLPAEAISDDLLQDWMERQKVSSRRPGSRRRRRRT